MANRWAWLAGGIVAVTVVALAGPRARIGPYDEAAARAAVPDDPAELDGWLAEREAALPDIVPGAEKRIRWAGEEGARTPLSIVFLHGWSASPPEVEPLISDVSAALGANAYLARLRGHGRSAEALEQATVGQWLEDTAEAMEIGATLGDEVLLIGNSTGATLAGGWAADHPDEPLVGLVAISPNFGPKNKAAELLLLPWVGMILPAVLGERSWEPRNQAHAKYWTSSYHHRALVPMMKLVDYARTRDWASFDHPVLMIRNPDDDTLDSSLMDEWVADLPEGSVTSVDIHPREGESGHVLAGDILSPSRTVEIGNLIVEMARGWR